LGFNKNVQQYIDREKLKQKQSDTLFQRDKNKTQSLLIRYIRLEESGTVLPKSAEYC